MSKLDDFVPASPPLRTIRLWLNDDTLKRMNRLLARMYESDAKGGRPSIVPKRPFARCCCRCCTRFEANAWS